MTEKRAGLAVIAHVGEVALALGDLMHGVVVTWSDGVGAWRLDVEHDGTERTFWYCGEGWRYEWAGRSWWRPVLWPVLDVDHLAAEMVLVVAGLVSWPAAVQHEGEQSGAENVELVSQ